MNNGILKIWSIVLSLVIFVALPVYAQGADTTIPFTEKLFKLETSELSNKFHILDQISDALPKFFQMAEYKDLLKTQSTHDLDLLSSYRAIRVKYQKIPSAFDGNKETSSGLFAPALNNFHDPICDVFFTSSSLDEALSKLQGKLKVGEIHIIKKTFTTFAEDLDKINRDSFASLQKNAKIMNSNFNQSKISEHFLKTRKFYNSLARKFKSILLLQSPNAGGFSGNSYGDHLIIRMPNSEIKDLNVLKMMISVMIHEATHHISANAPEKQKSALSKVFLTQVKEIKEPDFFMAIEEPLVMATQMIFVKNAYPEIDDKVLSNWFNHPLALKLAIILEDYLSQGKSIDSDFMKKCGMEYMSFHKGNNHG